MTPSKRWFTMVPTAALALVVLAACGGQQAAPEAPKAPAESTTAPAETSTEAPAATESAPAATESTPAAAAVATEAAPAATESTPAAASAATEAATTEATPAAMTATEAAPAAKAATEATPAATTASEATPAASASGGSAAAQEFTVTSHDIYFEPKELEIPADTDVKVLLPNQGAAPHNFSIDALKISVDMAPGEEKDATINAPAGEYEYYCNVPGHKQAGMVGKLTAK